MPKKETLQAFLSPQRLCELAGAKVYARGEQYLASDKVHLHEHTRDDAIADVIGSQPYRVELKLTPKGLAADCTCPAMPDYGFCKHAVALGLHLIGAKPPDAKTSIKPRQVEPDGLTEKYPCIAGWIEDGWMEIGRDGHSTSMIRLLDEGGMIWKGGNKTQIHIRSQAQHEKQVHFCFEKEFSMGRVYLVVVLPSGINAITDGF